jgi:hypothetical protein
MRPLPTRTWPYGTVKRGVVVCVEAAGRTRIVAFAADGEPREGFILAGQAGLSKARKGQRGTITFSRGGPTGGYWHWEPEAGQGPGAAS